MKIFDISQEVFGCEVYPGDPEPKLMPLCRMESGSLYNLSSFCMCAHNGTHIDAPFHFINDGKTVGMLDLEKMVGMAYVAENSGMITENEAHEMLTSAEAAGAECAKRILIKGGGIVTKEAARVFAGAGVYLIGSETQSVGPAEAPMAVHLILLSNEVILLEGIRLDAVPCGAYFLSAAPLMLNGSDGAPCRALLIKF